jgi:hypothetical protein
MHAPEKCLQILEQKAHEYVGDLGTHIRPLGVGRE